MKIIRPLFIVIIFLFSCKKDKLTDDNKILIGTWTSISNRCVCCIAIGTLYNPLYKLELIEKGKYILYQDGKKIEDGRLVNLNGFVTFQCSSKKSPFNGKKIDKFNSDTLNIDHRCKNEFEYIFVKK